ncbi:MAG: hypothetical protein R3E32_01595 [Chitinophagales bacterium]
MTKLLKSYRQIDNNILWLIAAAFCLQIINSAFFLTLNIYAQKSGYLDYQIADFISYRFLAVAGFAVPFGMFIKGKAIRPFFLAAAITLPLVSLLIVEVIEYQYDLLLKIALILWGISFSSLHILILPYIIRNEASDTHTEAISLNAASWSASIIIVGIFNFVLAYLIGDWFADHRLLDKRLLQLYSIVGVIAVFFILKMTKDEKLEEDTQTFHRSFRDYDWSLIIRAAIPLLMLAVGAGLTIPFINLFFFNVFGMDSNQFSLLGSITAVLVASTILLTPSIKKIFGYEAITITQTLAVLALLLLAISDFLSYWPFAIYLAIFCYFIRQPLMNLANPMTSEMTMYYVGRKNQELMSAITSSIWSGSWFFSSQIFRFLRKMDLRYGTIFVITACMYMLAVFAYFLLIKDYRRRETSELLK